jgi:flagellum-specific peptidoglycan hydrolase FlgJ
LVQLSQLVTDAAIAARKKWRVPASVTLAQYALESAWGKKVTGAFNYFGNKWDGKGTFTEVPTHEYVGGRYILINAKFKNFASVEDAFDFHGQLLATHPAYSHAMTLADHPEAFAQALTGVYATAPLYGDSLIEIMKSSGLEKYDV